MPNYLVKLKKARTVKEDIPVTAVGINEAVEQAVEEWKHYVLDRNEDIEYITTSEVNPDGMIRLKSSDLATEIEILSNNLDSFDFISFLALEDSYKQSLEVIYMDSTPFTSPPDLTGLSGLLDLRIGPNLEIIPDLTDLTSLTNLELSNNDFTSIADLVLPTTIETLKFINCSLLTTTRYLVGLNNLTSLNMSGCALTQTAVNTILTNLDSNGTTDGLVNLSGGTNSAPSGAGLTAKTSLEGKNWTVVVN